MSEGCYSNSITARRLAWFTVLGGGLDGKIVHADAFGGDQADRDALLDQRLADGLGPPLRQGLVVGLHPA